MNQDCIFKFLYHIIDQHKIAYNIKDTIIICGVDDNNIFCGLKPAARFVVGIFKDNFR